jgi:thiamine biosynthesis lipoprotein
MGSDFEITVVADTEEEASFFMEQAVAEIQRIERLISSWDEQSETAEVNRQAGQQPVKVSEELFQLVSRSLALSKLTDGAFDISFAGMNKLWTFNKGVQEMPSAEELAESVERVGYEHIVLNEQHQTIFLEKEGMKIAFGAIGKGYAADKVKQLLKEQGVLAGIINASGDMTTWGQQPNGEEWKVAITNPLNKSEAFALVPVSDKAVVTSGDYERYVMIDGKRYAHIINPKTGMPASGLISVTVFAPSAELADALATAVFVMGAEVGVDRINQMPGVEVVVVDEYGQLHTSKSMKINEN